MLFLRGWDPPSDGAREGKAVGAVMRWAPITLFDEGSWPMVRNLIDSAIIHTRATECQRFEVTRRAQPYQPPARRFTGVASGLRELAQQGAVDSRWMSVAGPMFSTEPAGISPSI